MTEKNVCPRQRMKEVREEVKDFTQGKPKSWMAAFQHLGEYPDNMEDARRTIIALQDLLDKSMERHAKATENLHELKEYHEGVMESVNANDLNMNSDMGQILSKNQGLRNQLNAAMTTIGTAMGGF